MRRELGMSMAVCGVWFCGGCAQAPTPAATAPPIAPAVPSDEPEASSPTARTASPKAEAACLPKSAVRGGVAHVEVKGERALACYLAEDDAPRAGDTHPCLRANVRTRAVLGSETRTQPESGRTQPSSAFEVSTTADSVKVCAQGSTKCSTIRVLNKPVTAGHGGGSDNTLIAAVNADGSRVFVFAPESTPAKAAAQPDVVTVYGDVFTLPQRKRVAHFKLTNLSGKSLFSDPSNSWSARFVGSKVVIDDYVCCGPGGVTLLFDPDAQRANVLHGYDGELLQLRGSVYAVRDGSKVTVFDVDGMRPFVQLATASESLGNPEEPDARIATDGSTLVIAYANPPRLLAMDLKTQMPTPEVPLPICP